MSRLFRDFLLVFVIVFALVLLLAMPVAAQSDDPTPQNDAVVVTASPEVRLVETPAPDIEAPAPADEPAPDDPVDPAEEALAFWLGMVAAVAGFLEWFKTVALKPAQSRFGFSDEWYNGIAMFMALLASLGLVFTVAEGRTVFDAIGLHVSNQVFAQFATAFVVTLGNAAIHQLYNLFVGWRAIQSASVLRSSRQYLLDSGYPPAQPVNPVTRP